MALLKTFDLKNLVASNDLSEDVCTRIVTVADQKKTVVKRRITKAYQFIGMDRETAELCVKAKQAQYFRERTYVNERGVLITEPAKVLAQIQPVNIVGDDWGVSVTLDQEDEVFIPEQQSGMPPPGVNEALEPLRRESFDQPVLPWNKTVSIGRIHYGVDTSLSADRPGFVVLYDGYQHSCFEPQDVNDYEAILCWRKEPLAETTWTASGMRDWDWQEGGMRFVNIPRFEYGDFAHFRLMLRHKSVASRHWLSNVVSVHWYPNF